MALQMTWQPSLLHQKRKNGPPLGLKNLGNSCYLNSVLQCLTYTPPLANFCLNHLHSSLCDSAVDRKRECPFCILEKRIVRSLSMDLTQDAPSKIQSCLRIFAEHFRLGRQEDAHEFLRYVIDACHNTCLRLKKLRRKGNNDNGPSTTSVVKDIFGGALQSQVKCLSCGAESNKTDEIMDISLDVLHFNSLKQALQNFFQPEVLDGNNKYKCDNCKKLVSARKQMSILQAPNVLVIQLKRFEGLYGGKIDKLIAFEEVLVLSSYMNKASQDSHPEYNLFATIVHSGYSPESGHYYAYIKDAMGCWYCCNDSYVSLSTLQGVLSEKVYILFFSRTNARISPPSKAFASHNVKNRDCNGNNTSKNPRTALPVKTRHTKQNVEHSSGMDTSTISKVDKVPSSLQIKSNSFEKTVSKRVLATGNGKLDVHKNQILEKNGDVVGKSEKGTPSLANSNGFSINKRVDAADSVNGFVSANENDKLQNISGNSGKVDLYEGNVVKSRMTAEGRSNFHEVHNGGVKCPPGVSGVKRKSQDKGSCILLAQDAHSLAKVEEFKDGLKKEASLVLRSCGWTDRLYIFMHSRKRLCAQKSGDPPSSNESKKSFIADAKQSFISQIPESLKEKLIERLKSFSQEKQVSGP